MINPRNDILFQQLDSYSSSPVLFVGSGISFRYLGTERWEALLQRFSEQIEIPFEKYKSRANGNWPKVGGLLADDYNNYWFSNSKMIDIREKNKDYMTTLSSPLKVMISEHMKGFSVKDDCNLAVEIGLLKAAKIDGIITTNYDLLLEGIFPDFKVYKSQRELIFSSLQEVGEIYKIHGCCTEPNSLVITDDDYKNFQEKNAYLAAKLLTSFLEHPIIFLGYSITDPNIRDILKSMIACLDQNQVDQLSKRLYFVEYHAGLESIVLEKYNLDIGGSSLPLTRILADSYVEIYGALASLHRRYSASFLRKIKEHIYELVSTNDPSEKITVVDFDNSTNFEQVEVVLGIGLNPSGNEKFKGYSGYTGLDLALDIVHNEHKLNAQEVCNKTLPQIFRINSWIPLCKYVSQCTNEGGIETRFLLRSNKPLSDWQKGLPQSHKVSEINNLYASVEELISSTDPKSALTLIPLLSSEKIAISTLRTFLIDNQYFINENYTKSYWMRLACLLDRLEYGPHTVESYESDGDYNQMASTSFTS